MAPVTIAVGILRLGWLRGVLLFRDRSRGWYNDRDDRESVDKEPVFINLLLLDPSRSSTDLVSRRSLEMNRNLPTWVETVFAL